MNALTALTLALVCQANDCDLPTRHDVYVAYTSLSAQARNIDDAVAVMLDTMPTANLIGLKGIHYDETGETACLVDDSVWDWLHDRDDGHLDDVTDEADALGADLIVFFMFSHPDDCCATEICSDGVLVVNVGTAGCENFEPGTFLQRNVIDGGEDKAANQACATICPEDHDSDGWVGVSDLLISLEHGDVHDLLEVVAAWGGCE